MLDNRNQPMPQSAPAQDCVEEHRELICISCPFGCRLRAVVRENEIVSLEGQRCERGRAYAATELFHPQRTVTGTVRILNARRPVLPVRSRGMVDRNAVPAVAAALGSVVVKAPVTDGEVVAVAAGVEFLATRPMESISVKGSNE